LTKNWRQSPRIGLRIRGVGIKQTKTGLRIRGVRIRQAKIGLWITIGLRIRGLRIRGVSRIMRLPHYVRNDKKGLQHCHNDK